LAIAGLLAVYGPQLGRPHADTLSASRHKNMKELRFHADGGVWRVAFAFDPEREAILLVAGDKTGVAQKRFYKTLIAKAHKRFEEHLAEIVAALPASRRRRVEARTQELVAEVEGLKALRQLTQRSQEQMAEALGVKQPSVHKIERQTDLYLSTLRRFVEAAGGTLELRVELPGKGVLHLTGVGDIHT
jgi:DNA-binding XRE family transcriptional regulator